MTHPFVAVPLPCTVSSQVSEEYALALTEQLKTAQAEIATLQSGSAEAVAKARDLELAKRQGEVFQGELLANIEKAAASSKTFIAGMRTKHAAEKKALQEQVDELKAQVKTATQEALENKRAFETLAVEEAKWSSERQQLLERSVSLDQTEGCVNALICCSFSYSPPHLAVHDLSHGAFSSLHHSMNDLLASRCLWNSLAHGESLLDAGTCRRRQSTFRTSKARLSSCKSHWRMRNSHLSPLFRRVWCQRCEWSRLTLRSRISLGSWWLTSPQLSTQRMRTARTTRASHSSPLFASPLLIAVFLAFVLALFCAASV